MIRMMTRTAMISLSVLAFALSGCAALGIGGARGTDAETATAIAAAAVGSHRSEANIARNIYRHPLETLTFFGLRRDMTVVEVLPGGLWYSEILAPVLREEGEYIAAGYDVDLPDQPEYRMRGHNYLLGRMKDEPEIFGGTKIGKLTAPVSIDLGPPASADMVVTFRSNHGWIRDESIDAVYSAFFEVLKSGGVLGVVQHRAGAATDTSAFTGYVEQDKLIELITSAGFVLEATSEVNANARDMANYEGGVWTLPPSLRKGDEDRAKYLGIGESDRMTLRFRKP